MKRLTRDKCLKIIQEDYDPEINYLEVSEKYLEILKKFLSILHMVLFCV